MKSSAFPMLRVLVLMLGLPSALLAQQGEADPPAMDGDPELARLEESYINAIKKARKELGEKYLAALKRLQDGLTREGNLAQAMLVKQEADRVQESLEQAPVIAPAEEEAEPILLGGAEANLGGKMRVSAANGAIYRWGKRGTFVEWTLAEDLKPGTYEVVLDYSCGEGGGGTFDVAVGEDQELSGTVSRSGEWSDWRQMYLGDARLEPQVPLRITATGVADTYLMNVRSVTLAPKGWWDRKQREDIAAAQVAAAAPPDPASATEPGEPAPPESGFVQLDGAVWTAHAANDGDSFYVTHEGNRYHLRLCFVDAPENDASHLEDAETAEELAGKAKYFGISAASYVATGKAAAVYAKTALEGKPLVVHLTDKVPERGDPSRRLALVEVGGKLFSEQLVSKGLVTLNGPAIDLPNGMSAENFMANLKATEKRAQVAGVGGWGRRAGE